MHYFPFHSILFSSTDPLPTRPAVTTPGTATPTSVVLSWNQQALADSYELSFQRATGNQQFGDCSSFVHSGTIPVGGTITTYNLTGLQEFSTYFITVTAVSVAGRNGSNILTVNTKIAGMYLAHQRNQPKPKLHVLREPLTQQIFELVMSLPAMSY